MAKSKEMEKLLENFTKHFFGNSRQEAASNQSCVMCGGPALYFKDALSKKEYEISRMCQSCQDKVFGSEDNEDL